MSEFDLLVLGDCNPDIVLSGGHVDPVFGQVERLVGDAKLTVGGSGAITACGAAGLGLRTAFVGVVGDDLLGRFMVDALTAGGVDVSGTLVDPEHPTGLSVILLQPGGGDRAILTAPGTSALLSAEMVPSRLISSSRHIHVSSFFLQSALRPGLASLFGSARASGITTSIDPNWDPAEEWDGGLRAILPSCDVLLLNAVESAKIAGTDATDATDAAATLAADGSLVVVKDGRSGALAVHAGEVSSVAAPEVDAVDSTGAGDSFDAGFLAGYLNGSELQRSLALACACGGLSTRAVGGTTAQPSMEEALAVAHELTRSGGGSDRSPYSSG